MDPKGRLPGNSAYRLDDLIEMLQKAREVHGNARVLVVDEKLAGKPPALQSCVALNEPWTGDAEWRNDQNHTQPYYGWTWDKSVEETLPGDQNYLSITRRQSPDAELALLIF